MRTNSSKLNAEFNIESITPEIAAKIVKHFILPMFENAPSAKVGRRLGHKNSLTQGGSNSIYGELKLSDKLNESLEQVRSEVTQLTESLEIEAQRRKQLELQTQAIRLKLTQRTQQVNLLNSELNKRKESDKKMQQFVACMRQNGDVLRQISDYNESMRRRCQHELQKANGKIDSD